MLPCRRWVQLGLLSLMVGIIRVEKIHWRRSLPPQGLLDPSKYRQERHWLTFFVGQLQIVSKLMPAIPPCCFAPYQIAATVPSKPPASCARGKAGLRASCLVRAWWWACLDTKGSRKPGHEEPAPFEFNGCSPGWCSQHIPLRVACFIFRSLFNDIPSSIILVRRGNFGASDGMDYTVECRGQQYPWSHFVIHTWSIEPFLSSQSTTSACVAGSSHPGHLPKKELSFPCCVM